MKKYNIGICNNEKSTCTAIEDTVYNFFRNSKYNVEIEVWYSGETLLESLSSGYEISILFLGVEFPKMNGIDIGKYIRYTLSDGSMQIVYTSSNDNLALDMFQIHPYDFLKEPIDDITVYNTLQNILKFDENDKSIFQYKCRRELKEIAVEKIMYLESKNKHIVLHLNDGNNIEYRGKLSAEAERLPEQFTAVSKSYYVNMKYIYLTSARSIQLINKENINISASHRNDFKNTFSRFLGENASIE